MSNAEPHIREGVKLLQRGKLAKAKAAFEQARAIDGESALARSYAGLLAGLADKNFETAEELCFRTAVKEPRNAQIQANMAWLQSMQGRRRSAVDYANKALAIDPGNADALRIVKLLGSRRPPPLSFVSRSHPLNRLLGKIRHKLLGG